MKAVNKRSAPKTDLSGATRTWVVKNAVFLIVPVACLLSASGDLTWAMGWAYIGMVIAVQVINALVLIPRYPDLVEERSRMQAGTKSWDQWLSVSMAIVIPALTWLVAGLDRRFGWSPELGLSVQVLSLIVVLTGALFTTWAMAVNRFFSGTVRIQTERSHTVVRGGPYEYIRHPGYAGALIYLLFTPLALGSLWAFIPAALFVAVVVVRTQLEDRTLQAELEGYKKYARRVRFRLLPGVW